MISTDMHQEDSDCSELTGCTAKAMKNDILVQLFISTQQNNVNICIEYAIRWVVINELKYLNILT
jgi:hypothetical protein